MNLLPAQTLSGVDRIHHGNALSVLRRLPSASVQTIVTSPPYFGLRDYGVDGQIGLEQTPQEYVAALVAVFREVRRVLRDDGTLWLNLGDSYREKQLVGIPWMTAFALRDDKWVLRSEIIWSKPNAMPEPVKDRPVKSHEHMFLFSKAASYYYDAIAVLEPRNAESAARNGTRSIKTKASAYAPLDRNDSDRARFGSPNGDMRHRRTVWDINTAHNKALHFATFPPKLIEPCILAGAPVGGVVLDPFFGSGTTGAVAIQHGRHYVGIELNAEYIEIANGRLAAARVQASKPKQLALGVAA